MSFGARLTQVRKEKKLTQEQLGKGLGTDGKDASKAVVYGWEKDQHYPRVDQLEMICQKLGCSADFLLFGVVAAQQLEPEVAEVATKINKIPPGWKRDLVMQQIANAFDVIRQAERQEASNTKGSTAEVPASPIRRTGGN